MEKFEEKIELKKEKEAKIKPPEFEIGEFEASRKAFKNLTKELTPAIKRHEYSLIIGDDTSGRLATRVMGDFFKAIYKEDDVKPPRVLFFAAGRRISSERDRIAEAIGSHIQDSIKRNKIDPSKDKALLTTEHIGTGQSADSLLRVFKKAGLSCDIATLSLHKDPKFYKHSGFFKGSNLYSGGGRGLYFWPKKTMAGVEKADDKIFAVPLRKDFLGYSSETKRKSREDAKKMANYLKQIYDREKEKIEKTKE